MRSGKVDWMVVDQFKNHLGDTMKLNAKQEQLNARYLARAQTVLSDEQFTSYQKSLKSQEEMTKMGMKMAAQMFGPRK